MSETHKKLRELLAKASYGEWAYDEASGHIFSVATDGSLVDGLPIHKSVADMYNPPSGRAKADGAFIVAARNNLTALLDRIDTLESAVQSARNEALEEAAEIVFKTDTVKHENGPNTNSCTACTCAVAERAIRALKTEAPK